MLIKIICGFFRQRRHSIKGLVIDGISRKFSIEILLAWPGEDVDWSLCKSRSGIQTKMWRYIGWRYIEVLHGESQFWGGQGLKTSPWFKNCQWNIDKLRFSKWLWLVRIEVGAIKFHPRSNNILITTSLQVPLQWFLGIFGNVSGIENQFLCLLFDV